jgi:hypothetical protein
VSLGVILRDILRVSLRDILSVSLRVTLSDILREAKDRCRAKAVKLPRGRAILQSPDASRRLPQDDSASD